jgi:hypothetical protein
MKGRADQIEQVAARDKAAERHTMSNEAAEEQTVPNKAAVEQATSGGLEYWKPIK